MSLDRTKFDVERLKKDIGSAITDGILDLVEGSKEDVEKFAQQIAWDMLEAQFEGEPEIQDQLLDQLKILGEINRVRVENHTWIVVFKVVRAILEAVVATAVAALF